MVETKVHIQRLMSEKEFPLGNDTDKPSWQELPCLRVSYAYAHIVTRYYLYHLLSTSILLLLWSYFVDNYSVVGREIYQYEQSDDSQSAGGSTKKLLDSNMYDKPYECSYDAPCLRISLNGEARYFNIPYSTRFRFAMVLYWFVLLINDTSW